MIISCNKTRLLLSCIMFSMLSHILVFSALGMFGTYDFSAPVNPTQAVMIDLANPNEATAQTRNHGGQKIGDASQAREGTTTEKNLAHTQEKDNHPSPTAPEQLQTEPGPAVAPVIDAEKSASRTISAESTNVDSPEEPPQHVTANLSPLRTAGEFLTESTEKLSYLISILGIPVGSAELMASNIKGEVHITLEVKSNAALASIYPVNDLMETRHIAGNFVITNIRQQEGDFRSDVGFTIFLRDKSVFWFDRLRKRYSRETVPNSEVLDVLSGFYLLRNRALRIGKTETLDIYDGDTYAPVLVQVLRQETIRLPNLRKIDSLVIHPIRKNGGTFRKAGDMLIWLTNDENKVPVKVETSLPLGKVTAELISAEAVQ